MTVCIRLGKIKEGVKLCMGRGGLGTTRSYRAHPRFLKSFYESLRTFFSPSNSYFINYNILVCQMLAIGYLPDFNLSISYKYFFYFQRVLR